MKKTLLLILAISLLSCQNQPNTSGSPLIQVRNAIGKDAVISIKDDVSKIEYIPLETTDASLISNVLSVQVNDKYIFCYNGMTDQILQFDRKGNFLRLISSPGNGPGEYGMVDELYIDNHNQELYVFQVYDSPMIYSFEGEYLRTDTTLQQAGSMHKLSNGKKALRGKRMVPIQQSPWLVALQDEKGNITDEKSPFPASLDPGVCFMNEISFTPSGNSALGFTSCNDTIFRVQENGITPAYILNRENPAEYYTTIADINKFNQGIDSESVINVYDFFETSNYFYCRVYRGDDIYIVRYDRESKELVSHKVPAAYLECSRSIPGNNVIGIDNDLDNGVPFWPEFYVNENSRAQIVDSYKIGCLQEKGYLNDMPETLKIGEDDNPVIIVYTFK